MVSFTNFRNISVKNVVIPIWYKTFNSLQSGAWILKTRLKNCFGKSQKHTFPIWVQKILSSFGFDFSPQVSGRNRIPSTFLSVFAAPSSSEFVIAAGAPCPRVGSASLHRPPPDSYVYGGPKSTKYKSTNSLKIQ